MEEAMCSLNLNKKITKIIKKKILMMQKNSLSVFTNLIYQYTIYLLFIVVEPTLTHETRESVIYLYMTREKGCWGLQRPAHRFM